MLFRAVNEYIDATTERKIYIALLISEIFIFKFLSRAQEWKTKILIAADIYMKNITEAQTK